MARKIEKTSSGNGYCKMPDGTLIQWGNASIPANSDRVEISFPIAFSDIYRQIFFNVEENNYSGIPVLFDWQRLNNKFYALNKGSAQSKVVNFDWLAIGRWK